MESQSLLGPLLELDEGDAPGRTASAERGSTAASAGVRSLADTLDDWDNSEERAEVKRRQTRSGTRSSVATQGFRRSTSRRLTGRNQLGKQGSRSSILGRSSVLARSSVLGRGGSSSWFDQQEDDACSGILADFVKRERARVPASERMDDSVEWFHRVVTRSQLFPESSVDMMVGVLKYEQLNALMMASVVRECKDRGLFVSTPPSSFKQQCKTIHQLKRITLMISTAVHNWHFTFKLLNNPGYEAKEDQRERMVRKEEFWSEGFWSKHDLPLRDHHVDIKEEYPRYDMRLELHNGQGAFRWSLVKPLGTLAHQQHTHEGLLTLNNRPEDAAGDGRFPPDVDVSVKDYSVTHALRPVRKGKRHYFDQCHERRVVPNPILFMTGHTRNFKANGQLFTDAEMSAAMALLNEDHAVHELDLTNNALLTDKSLGPLLAKLNNELLCAELQRFSLSSCRQAGRESIRRAIELTQTAGKLAYLNLSHIAIGTHSLLPLCKAIGQHKALHEVAIAGIGLGNNLALTTNCLDMLFVNKALQKLDLSWNRFCHEEFDQMGKLISQGCLQELSVDYCAAYVVGRDSPVAELLEGLARDSTLKKLSLVANRIDFRSALVIEDALDMHPTLKDIDMTDNPLGALGMRSLLRLLSRQTNTLSHFRSEGCYQGITAMIDADSSQGCQVYSFTNPGSRYVLDLSRPYCRSLLRILYKTAERCKIPLEKAFEIVESSFPYQHAPKDRGLWQVATTGRLVLVFSVEAQIQSALSGVEDDDFLCFLDTHFELTRFKADRKKITALFAKWLELEGREADQTVYLEALAKDFNMSLPYLSYLCRSSPSSVRRTMMTMFPTVPSDDQSRYLAMLCFPKLHDFYTCYHSMESLLIFNPQNATGHYKLDLGNNCEFAVAQRLILLDRWEAVVNKRRSRVDTSAMANRSQLRNEMHQGRPLHLRVKSVAEWSLPEYDIFELDYISAYRPPANAEALSDELWEDLMVTMYYSEARPQDKIKVLRSISHLIFITCMHMRQMVGYFKDPVAEDPDKDPSEREDPFLAREEAFVTFYLRIIDMHNSKQFLVRFEKQEELSRLRSRLGYVAAFPFIQPENTKFVLNLKYHDQRLCVSMIVDLALHEKYGNIRDYSLTNEDGTTDPMTMGVPRSWADLAKLPSSGVFRCRYVCSPEDRQVEFRKKLAQTYGYMAGNFSPSDVSWWTGLKEAGDDVLDLLEFFISRYNHVDEAFRDIDGGVKEGENANTTSNGELTLREFEAGLKDIGCFKFKGPNEKERIGAVFRYLDPGGEGNVSLQEWQILDQLWKEFVLSIQEFVQFLIFVFGEDLEEAWITLDDDESGELSEDEWNKAVADIGYFGPSRVVFALLDGSDDGNISYDEFKVLEKYRPKRQIAKNKKK